MNGLGLQVGVSTEATGGGVLSYGDDITTEEFTLTNENFGVNKITKIVGDEAQKIIIDPANLTLPAIFNGFRKGTGILEIDPINGLRIDATRDEQNRIAVDGNNKSFSIMLRSATEGQATGALKLGSQGKVTILSYSTITVEENETISINVVGTGFSANMEVNALQNATISNFVFTDDTHISFDLTATGSNDDTISIEFYNGESYIDTDVITIGQRFFVDDYPFKSIVFPIRTNGGNPYYFRARRVNDGAETDVLWNANGKADGTSQVAAGGTLDQWRGGNDIVASRIYNAGTSAGYFFTADPAKMPKASSGGTLHLWNNSITFDYDGADDEIETTFTDTWINGHLRSIIAFNYSDGTNSTILASKTNANGGFMFRVLDNKINATIGSANDSDDEILSPSTEYVFTLHNDRTNIKFFKGDTEVHSFPVGAENLNDETLKMGGIVPNDNAQFQGFIRYALCGDNDFSEVEMIAIRAALTNLL